MNKESIKQLINAHGWLGLIISGVLFVVFFAGSISFFRPEIMAWSMQPHFEVNKGQQAPVSEILASALANRNYDAKEHLTLIFPRDDNPYYRAYIDIKDRPVEPHYDALTIDPVTAKIIYEGDKFELADFLYLMHINLHIPFGSYVVGFVALFFFFALISGVFIHARKLLRNFFQYRNGDHKRSQLLDMHNVVGVMSLPFTIMYALTGLIFNLVIIYQASFAMILYQGDQDKLVQDAGYVLIAPEWQDKPSPMTDIDNIIDATTEKYGVAPRVVTFYNYGDAGSVMQIRGVDAHEFGSQFNVSYSTVDGSLLRSQDKFNPNIFQQGLNSLSKLHFGDYAGIDLRIIYFLLGMAVCALIMTGNLLWIEKRVKQRNAAPLTIAIARYVTNLGSAGFILATCVAFLAERLLSLNVTNRIDVMMLSFWLTFALYALVLLSPIAKNQRRLLGQTFYLGAALLISTVFIDWFMFAQTLILQWQQGHRATISVEIGLVICGILMFCIGRNFCKNEYVILSDEAANQINEDNSVKQPLVS